MEFEDEEADDIDYEAEAIDVDCENGEVAQGTDFNELKKAVEVVNEPSPTEVQKDEAGETFLKIENNDVYIKIINEDSEKQKFIEALIERHINAQIQEKGGESKPVDKQSEFSDFDISKYVKLNFKPMTKKNYG